MTYSIGAKLLLLRTYYEIDEFMALDSLIDSVRIYLRRNRVIAKTMVREFSNFLNFLKKLSTMDTHNKAELQEFYTKVKNNPAVISKKWLWRKLSIWGPCGDDKAQNPYSPLHHDAPLCRISHPWLQTQLLGKFGLVQAL